MLFFGSAENEDVVYVDNHDTLIYEFLEDVIHHCLKGRKTVHEAKEHDQGFKQAQFVWKAAFHLSPSLICMLLYPQGMSNFVKIFTLASETLLNMSGIRGRG